MRDLTQMNPMLHERKYEIDSLCYLVRLAMAIGRLRATAIFSKRRYGSMSSELF